MAQKAVFFSYCQSFKIPRIAITIHLINIAITIYKQPLAFAPSICISSVQPAWHADIYVLPSSPHTGEYLTKSQWQFPLQFVTFMLHNI